MWRVASDDTSGCNTRAGGSGALAWASILGSYSLFRQMAHVSAAFASRAAPQRGVCRVRVRSAGAVGTRPRRAGERAGRRAHRCKCPKTKTSRRSCPGERHALRRQASGRAAAATTRSQRSTGGGAAAPFLHDEAGPLLAVLLHVHLLIVRHSPSVETATMRDASVRRTASRVQVFCVCRRSARGVCEGWHAVEARGSGSTRAIQRSGSTRSIYTSAMCGSGVLTLSPPLPPCCCNPNNGGRPRWARSHRRSHTRERCVGGPCAPPPTRTARALASLRGVSHT